MACPEGLGEDGEAPGFVVEGGTAAGGEAGGAGAGLDTTGTGGGPPATCT